MEHQELGKRKRIPRNYEYFVDKQQLASSKPKKSIKQRVTFDSNTYYHDNNNNNTSSTSINDNDTNTNTNVDSAYGDEIMTTSTTSTTTLTNKRQRRNSKKIDIITSSSTSTSTRMPKSKRKRVSTVLAKGITKGMSKKMKDKIIKQNAKLKNNKKLKRKVIQPPTKVVVIEAPIIDERLISYIPWKVELSKSDIACQLILSDDCLTCYGSEVIIILMIIVIIIYIL